VFPARSFSTDPHTGAGRRHHQHESRLQKAIKTAARKAGIVRPVSCRALRHSFVTHLLEAGSDWRSPLRTPLRPLGEFRTVQELLGHANVETTMKYAHVLNRPGIVPVKSPLDAV